MSTLIPITQTADGRQAVAGRALHEFLEIQTPYNKWFPRMVEYGFTEDQDFTTFLSESTGGRRAEDHILTLDMGKEVSMIQRNEKGRQARQYFIECEKRAKDAPALTGKALLAQAVLEAQDTITALEVENREQAAQIEQDAPKVEYHDDFVADDDMLTFSTVASNLGIKESRLRELLLAHKWIYKETRTRWSQSKQKKVARYRYTECADKKAYFDRNLHHDVPRFGGQVMHTLMITPAGAVAVTRAVRKWLGGQGELEVISGGAA